MQRHVPRSPSRPRDARVGRGAPDAASRRLRLTAAAAGFVVLAVFCFSILDATGKDLATRYPVPFIVWARYVVQLVVLLLWLGPRIGPQLVRANRHGLQILRGAALIGSSTLAVLAFRRLPLADATALNYSSPALVMLLAALTLDERFTAQRVLFLLAGIVGMVLIVRPGTEVFDRGALFAIGCAACYAVYQVLTRMLGGEDVRVLLVYGTLVGAVAMSGLLPTFDVPPQVPAIDIVMLVGTGILGGIGHFLFISALQRAPASAVSPFTYVQLVFATLIGWVVFGQLPDRWTVCGMAVVAASGIFTLWYERRRTFARMAEPPGPE